jgi:hypothetical protein
VRIISARHDQQDHRERHLRNDALSDVLDSLLGQVSDIDGPLCALAMLVFRT